MSLEKLVCTACACLCDDIELEINDNKIVRINNACSKSSAFLYASQIKKNRALFLVGGHEVTKDEAIQKAGDLLKQSNNLLIAGLDNSTLEAQSIAIKMAESLGATIDDTSSYCKGELLQKILSGIIPTCSFDVAKKADLLVFWGANPYHSHPRHLSLFSYYANPRFEEAGWYPASKVVCIEVRETETTELCDHSIKILPGKDVKLINDIISAVDGNQTGEDIQQFIEMIDKSDNCVIYAGLGLDYSIDGNYDLFVKMTEKLGKLTNVVTIPMIGHYNMRGFNQQLFDKTGYVNKISFAKGISHGIEFSITEQMNNKVPDCIFFAGLDPIVSLPDSLVKKIKDIPIITLDPFYTKTSKMSDVVIGTAVSGLEASGSALRMDGVKIFLNKVISSLFPSDEEVMNKLFERVS